ncbi:MAG TPA: L-glutamate gamma-semialdehyde dehydrogenase [bacterium]|nr:L-glutamate gamma-semialdehyde dehydrogenase [bacterium]
MADGRFRTRMPANEPVLSYEPGTPERAELKDTVRRMGGREIEIPLVIGGKNVKTGRLGDCRAPHEHDHLLGRWHKAQKKEVDQAIVAAEKAWHDWSRMDWADRAAIFLRAAELLAGPHRQTVNAATMLGQSKTCHQAEIDSACELIDFWRFNVNYLQQIYEEQPESAPGIWNRMEYRPLEGFVFAVTPFNFTSIAGNLPTAPALMGNTVLWKPASSAVYSAHYLMEVLHEAGLPPGVINFVPGSGGDVGDPAFASASLAGVHFTGSTEVFQGVWKTIGTNIAAYRNYPRIVGETGGKDFVFAHPTADVGEVAAGLVRGAFEYQGQKCSAASRAYIPKSLWKRVEKELLTQIGEIRMGDPTDFTNFMGAVIDKGAFRDISGYIAHAKRSKDATVIAGGKCDDSKGWFIEPTVVLTTNPEHKLMREEIFGPVLTIHVYPDRQLDKALELCDTASPYALTGAVFARDRRAVVHMADKLRHTAGNFYINDKPTGAVVNQQPFGGSRASGTNDKAGSKQNLQRWVTPRSIKETFVPPRHFSYPFLAPDASAD